MNDWWKPKTMWAKIVAGIGLVGTIIGIIIGVEKLIPDPKPPRVSAVFILDVSPAMNEKFGHMTRLAAAKNAIIGIMGSIPGASTSLRLINPGCETGYADPTIPFGKSNAARYEDVFGHHTAQQVSPYIKGLNSANNDLTSKKLIQDSKVKLLVVFVADTGHTCESFLPLLPIGQGLSIKFWFFSTSSQSLGGIQTQLQDLGFLDPYVRKFGTTKQAKAAVKKTVRIRSASGGVPSTPPPTTTSTVPTTTTTESTAIQTVPDVIGLSLEAARAQLQATGFTVASPVLLEVADPSQQGIVLTQAPTGNSQAASGSTVQLSVGHFSGP
jgi:hypothetical protein